ncbi:MAG: aminoacyl-tRNA hydrolase [Planctomyces sp.]|nr:aminoacyl-tRNA hydrolase [Planctomyces sp.]
MMKLIVGLGNPGSEYATTRHNAGFMALDAAARRLMPGELPRGRFGGEAREGQVAGAAGGGTGGVGGVGGGGAEKALLLKPLGFMNRSGGPVAEAVAFYKIDPSADLLVLVDDYALPFGTLRVRPEGSHGGHNGLRDIQRALGTEAYPRLRIGIDPPPPAYDDPADWVLGRFSEPQLAALRPVFDRCALAVETFVTRGVAATMNAFNGAQPSAAPPSPP